MNLQAKICLTSMCGLLSSVAWAQTTPTTPPPQPAKPGITVQAPGVRVQTPGANPQAPAGGVQVQAPGVNLQVPGARVQAGAQNGAQVGVYNGYPQTPWFSNPSVRQQLQLNEQQYNQLNQSYGKAWTQYNKERNLIDNKLTPEQRQQREGELSSSFQRSFSPAVDSTFSDPAARQRYNQLYWQYQGYDAFRDPTVQQQLNLTPEQQQKLNQYGTAWNQQYHTWQTQYPQNREQVRQQFRDARRASRQRIDSVLTPEQQQQWNKMVGKPYEFPEDVYFPQTTTNTTLKPATE